jgi:hypothetical protein
MNGKAGSVITAFMTVALVTVFILPRKGSPVSTVVSEMGEYMAGAIKSMLGTTPVVTNKKPKGGTIQ